MPATREKFATQVNSEILSEIRRIAEKEGRQLQALVDEALADLIEKRKSGKPSRRASCGAGHWPRNSSDGDSMPATCWRDRMLRGGATCNW